MRRIIFGAVTLLTGGIVIFIGLNERSLRNRLAALEEKDAASASQLELLTKERDDAINKVAALSQELEGRNHGDLELLRLRGEIARLRQQGQELPAPNPASQPITSAKQPFVPGNLLEGPMGLKQFLQQFPDKNIPETQYLVDEDWFEIVRRSKMPLRPQTDDDFRELLSAIRQQAKQRFARPLSRALDAFVEENGGTLPTEVSQLKPYFGVGQVRPDEFVPPMDDSVLERYQIIQTGKASEIKAGEGILSEKAPVDDQFDTIFQIGLNNYTMNGVGRNHVQGKSSWASTSSYPRPK